MAALVTCMFRELTACLATPPDGPGQTRASLLLSLRCGDRTLGSKAAARSALVILRVRGKSSAAAASRIYRGRTPCRRIPP